MHFPGWIRSLPGRNSLWLISTVYLLIRTIRLGSLPLFNDEAIYLDWGWREVTRPGYLFYSLYDAKPPLIMWLFGISQMLLTNQVIAGRIVSVGFGLAALLGLYTLARMYLPKTYANLTAILYIVIPLTAFFDRQALMETPLVAGGIWFFVLLLKSRRGTWLTAVCAGVTGAIALYIKSSSAAFLAAAVLLVVYQYFADRQGRRVFLRNILLAGISGFLVYLPLLTAPRYLSTLPTNARYSLTIAEIIALPVGHWIQTILRFTEISFWHLTPPVALLGLTGLILAVRRSETRFVGLYWLSVAGVSLLSARDLIERYSVMPLAAVPFMTALAVSAIPQKIRPLIITAVLVITVGLTLLQAADGSRYLGIIRAFTGFGLYEYTDGVTSGYGIDEVVTFVRRSVGSRPAHIGLALNTGNPESAVIVRFHHDPHVSVGYLDPRIYPVDFSRYDCLSSDIPVYFVSRGDDLAGLERFFKKVYEVTNPRGGNRTGVWELSEYCSGTVYRLEHYLKAN
ncbi:hypothetical protein A2Z33_01230 [Candidatus Gottesmanbacteria bacterium RBG_16_52_11]|uniref:Glycosyltransferase RgtA/B/C/D-like domain-containing protein n=1 Tax=Candidatus Gottesmanbacteria bacterium RBG_16_52_11 TaxID=1798374 RepID=A0A1F5YP04_9BACT|nr:MAG: hypothetical protein A2Z33_01230 [Candidatus Gottesmanbacteria bacterium RBG_16_52_11]